MARIVTEEMRQGAFPDIIVEYARLPSKASPWHRR